MVKQITPFLIIYLILSTIFTLDCLAYYFYQISLSGYYSDVILFWLWFITSIATIIRYWKKIIAKLFLTAIIASLVLSFLPMTIPFYAFLLATTPLGLVMDKNLNKNYRAQIVVYSVMTLPRLEIIEKKGLVEKRRFTCTDSQLLNDDVDVKIRTAKDLIFKNETDSTITLVLFYGGPNKTITFTKSTGKINSISN